MSMGNGEGEPPISILVVDDHAISRSGVVQLCALIPGATVLGEASTGEEALELARLHAPEVVLMDVEMPGTIDGIEATRQIKAELPNTAVIILTVHEDREVIFEAIKARASERSWSSSPMDRRRDRSRASSGSASARSTRTSATPIGSCRSTTASRPS